MVEYFCIPTLNRGRHASGQDIAKKNYRCIRQSWNPDPVEGSTVASPLLALPSCSRINDAIGLKLHSEYRLMLTAFVIHYPVSVSLS
jgi:hypothetical protein